MVGMQYKGNVPGHHKYYPSTDEAGAEDNFPSMSPHSPGSPLTYSSQIAVEPMSKEDAARNQELYDRPGYPAQPKLVPTMIVCRFLAFTWIFACNFFWAGSAMIFVREICWIAVICGQLTEPFAAPQGVMGGIM